MEFNSSDEDFDLLLSGSSAITFDVPDYLVINDSQAAFDAIPSPKLESSDRVDIEYSAMRARWPKSEQPAPTIYSCKNKDDTTALVFDSEVQGIRTWLRTNKITNTSLTVLNLNNTPHLIVFTGDGNLESIIEQCPTTLPVKLLNLPISYLAGKGKRDYGEKPKGAIWRHDLVIPGVDIGCGKAAAGTFGGYVKVEDGRILALTAGHVLRRDLENARRVVNGGELVYQPAKNSDAYFKLILRLKVVKWMVVAADAGNAAKLAHNKANVNKEDTILREEAVRLRAKFEEEKRYFQSWNAKMDLWEQKGSTRMGRAVVSVIGTTEMDTTFLKPENVPANTKTNEDWGLFSVDNDRLGSNAMQLLKDEIKLSTTSEIKEGMIVIKKGRSTGVTIGRVNGIKINTEIEGVFEPTTEWFVIPLTEAEIQEEGLESVREYMGRKLVQGVFAAEGDSGSLVIDFKTNAVVGMIIAGLERSKKTDGLNIAIVTPIKTVLRCMKKQLKQEVSLMS